MSFGIKLDNESLNSTLGQKELVVVDFWAPWCKNCPQVENVLKEVSGSLGNKRQRVLFANANVEEDGMLASKFGVKSLPSVLVFSSGRVMSQFSGTVEEEKLTDTILELLG